MKRRCFCIYLDRGLVLGISRKFLVLRLITKTYPRLIRVALAACAFVFGWLATGRRSLAKPIADKTKQPDGLLSGLRLTSWYVRRRWPSLRWLSKDSVYDFSTGMGVRQLDDSSQFLDHHAHRNDVTKIAADRMFIAARRLEAAENTPQWRSAHEVFVTACNQYLALTPLVSHQTAAPTHPSKKTFNLVQARAALTDFAALFPLAEYPWFIVSGTFLGLIREGSFLTHDYDIDLGIMAKDLDFPDLCHRLRASRQFALRKCDVQPAFQSNETSQPRPALVKITHQTGVEIDIFVHHTGMCRSGVGPKGADVLWHGSSLHRWENTPFDLAPYVMEGVSVLGPADADRYLIECYGDWRTPVKEFNCTTDTSNLVLVRHPSTVAIFLRKLVGRYTEQKPRWSALCNELVQNGFIVAQDASVGLYMVPLDLFEES